MRFWIRKSQIWAEDVSELNDRSCVPFAEILRRCQERVEDADQQKKEDLLDDVPTSCAKAAEAAASRQGYERLPFNSPLPGGGGGASSSDAGGLSTGDVPATTTTTGVGDEEGREVGSSSNGGTTPTAPTEVVTEVSPKKSRMPTGLLARMEEGGV